MKRTRGQFERLECRRVLASDLEIYRNGEVATDTDAADILATSQAMDASLLENHGVRVERFLTTAGPPSNYVSSPGGVHEGVVRVSIVHNSGTYSGTASLLPSGNDLLTASHLFVDPVFGTLAISANAYFDTLPNPISINFIDIGNYTGNDLQSGDLAIASLSQQAPASIPRYDIHRAGGETNAIFETVGYGRYGTGTQGDIFASGTKRSGFNRVEGYGQMLNGIDAAPGAYLSNSHLVFDFDNGIAANDAAGVRLGISNVGLGASEVNTARGDSGGPAFIANRIAGVTSFGYGYNFGPDVTPGVTDSSYGEMSVDTRVAAYANFVDAYINQPGAPTILDVVLRGSGWANGVDYSFSDAIAVGDQLRPVATQGVNSISIQFSEHVRLRGSNGTLSDLNGSVLELRQTTRTDQAPATNATVAATNFSYDVGTHTATWTFSTLPDGKYAIHLNSPGPGVSGVVDVLNTALDADWDNLTAGTPDNFADDPVRTFVTGDGVAGTEGNKFRFHFALLAGDYNGSGKVDASDASPLGDGNGDGLVNSSDESVRLSNLNDYLPLRNIGGADLKDDEIVNGFDLTIWKNGFGGTAAGDVNGDGIVDGADFLAWQRLYLTQSAWYEGDAQLAPAVLAGLAPQVSNVIISGSTSTHSPFSFATVDGSGNQLKTVPVGGADTISIVFSENVNVLPDSLDVVGLRTANIPQRASFSYNPLTFTATWRFVGWAISDQYALVLSDQVTDADGNWLDGDWVNPATTTTVNSLVSEFPSGDGSPGGIFSFVMTILPGDANLDGAVNSTDYTAYLLNLYGPPGPRVFTQADFNGDGVTNSADIDLMLASWQDSLQSILIASDIDGDFDVDADDIAIIDDDATLTGPGLDGDVNEDWIVDVEDLDWAFAQFDLSLNVVS